MLGLEIIKMLHFLDLCLSFNIPPFCYFHLNFSCVTLKIMKVDRKLEKKLSEFKLEKRDGIAPEIRKPNIFSCNSLSDNIRK